MKNFASSLPWGLLTTIALVIFLSSGCEINNRPYGQPGIAMVSLQWEVARPDYLNTGTPDIPPLFEYGRFYPVAPGTYTLQYGGQFYNNGFYDNYAWEMEYQVWQNPPPQNHSQTNGPNSYLSLVCSPFGPFSQRFNKALMPDSFDLIHFSDSLILIEQHRGYYSLRAKYRKLNPSDQDKKIEGLANQPFDY